MDVRAPAGGTLYAFRDDHGQWIAFPTEERARSMVPREGTEVKEITFGELLDDNPKNLIHLFEQYYWAEDLG